MLNLTILQARYDTREAPWYGAWNIVLRDMFRDFCPNSKGFFTVTYPQFSLVKNIDAVDSDESDEEMAASDQAGFYPLLLIKYMLINSVLQVKIFQRSAAPSPESPETLRGYRHSRSGLLQTPPRLSFSSKKPRLRRSLRIPDFAQVLFEIKLNKDGTLDLPLVYRAGPLLLVEIKKAKPSCQAYDITLSMNQTDEQAHHAFASYPRINDLGLIIAVGDCWIYREYSRIEQRPSQTPSERSDPKSVDPKSDADSKPNLPAPTIQSRKSENVEAAFGTPGFARLQTRQSDNALHAVKERLKFLGTNMFSSECKFKLFLLFLLHKN